tara:strand:- start:748 stop:870 length:123 start_codon:yes stop_codon:yes gene_type:complete
MIKNCFFSSKSIKNHQKTPKKHQKMQNSSKNESFFKHLKY